MNTLYLPFCLIVLSFLNLPLSQAQKPNEVKLDPLMHNLSMFNDPYELYIFPEQEKGKSIDIQMILMKDQKVILQEWINKDTIAQHCEIIQKDPLPVDFEKEYNLTEFKYHGVRSSAIYFYAYFKSPASKKSIPVMLKWYYIGPKKGKRLIHN